MIVHVLGNGPSIHCFEANLFHDEPEGTRVGCNWGHPHLNPLWNFMSSKELIRCAITNRKILTPIVTTREDLTIVHKFFIEAKLLDFLTTVDFYHVGKKKRKFAGKDPSEISCGHSACIFAILLHKPTEIHLWGLDFLWTGSLTSVQDKWRSTTIIPKAFPHHQLSSILDWWIEIFSDYPHIKFSIHAPTKIYNVPPNVQTILL